jgi:hypothetical protein
VPYLVDDASVGMEDSQLHSRIASRSSRRKAFSMTMMRARRAYGEPYVT